MRSRASEVWSFGPSRNDATLWRQRFHLGAQVGFSLEPDARQIRHDDVTVLDANTVGVTAIGLEQIWIAFIAAEAETGRDIQRHLMSAMRNTPARRPAAGLQHAKRALILAQPIRQRAIELQPVAVGPHPAVANEVARILMAEQVFAGRHRSGIEFRQRRLELEIERIAGLLVPEQRIFAQHLGVGDRGLKVEPAVGVDGELRLAADFLEHGLDALAVFRYR